MEEVWDILDEQGNLSGKTILRGDKLKKGEFHLVVHIWMLDENSKHLVQKRSLTQLWKPGVWATTGGSALAGETSIEAAMRETFEETGISLVAAQLRLVERVVRQDSIVDIWVANLHANQKASVKPNKEVAEISWLTVDEITKLIENELFVDYWKEEFYKTELDKIR